MSFDCSQYFARFGYQPPQISSPPTPSLATVITIPCYNEPALLDSLEALQRCDLPKQAVEVIVVVNSARTSPAMARQRNQLTLAHAAEWMAAHSDARRSYHIIEAADLPPRIAGVGLARKIAMDEALARFEKTGRDGIIAGFDADSLCDPNYLIALEEHFSKHPASPGCSIYFEHPVAGDEYTPAIYEGITHYELHLRYYVQSLRSAAYPYAFHTIGSSFAVRASVYRQQGGMNKRKAAEDFYFLQKLFPLGDFTELCGTRVIPSPRVSDRVPFGTGKAIADWLRSGTQGRHTYHPKIFDDLRQLCTAVPQLYGISERGVDTIINGLPEPLSAYLRSIAFRDAVAEIEANCGSHATFVQRLFRWLTNLRILKYVHFARDKHYPNVMLKQAASTLLQSLQVAESSSFGRDVPELLKAFRSLDRRQFGLMSMNNQAQL